MLDLSQYKTVYFIGIGGISMSALALILKQSGHSVKGYDRGKSIQTDELEREGITVYYDTGISDLSDVDLTVYTAAIPETHPEMISSAEHHIPCVSRAELLGAMVKKYSNSIGVSGAHGKSTVSGMISRIFLEDKDSDPTILVGAKLPYINGSTFRIGTDENFVFEACEYKDSFLSFYPHISIILNVEHDHPDYFKTIEQMTASFAQFAANAGESGYVVVNADSSHALEAAKSACGKVITYSISGNADYTAGEISYENGLPTFNVYHKGALLFNVSLSVSGVHNVSNALAACTASIISNVPYNAIIGGLKAFHGVNRRFEYKGTCNGASVYDDYAHHPDEIRATLATAKTLGKKRIICAFQPHTYTRLATFFDAFAKAFDDADVLLLSPVFAAREVNATGYTSETLCKATNNSQVFSCFDEIASKIKEIASPDDVIIVMGAGDINEVTPLILD